MKPGERALDRALKFIDKKNLDGLLITGRENNRYFSGFTGSDSTLLIVSNNGPNYFFTDSRYIEQAKKECPGWEVVEYKKVTEAVAEHIKELRLVKVAFESSQLSYNLYHRYVEALDSAVLIPQEKAIDQLRVCKTAEEIENITRAARMAEEALEECLPDLKPGVVEKDFALELEYRIREKGSEKMPFDIIVASGKRGAMPHGIASDKAIGNNEFVTIDFGAGFNGYKCDITVTVGIGEPGKKLRKVYQTVKDAHDAAIEGMKPGMELPQVDALARKYIEKKGYSKYFGHGLGHGVGLAVHEEPSLSPLADGVLLEGAVVTVEPGIYIPGTGGVRIEDTVYITKDGPRILTEMPKELRIVA